MRVSASIARGQESEMRTGLHRGASCEANCYIQCGRCPGWLDASEADA